MFWRKWLGKASSPDKLDPARARALVDAAIASDRESFDQAADDAAAFLMRQHEILSLNSNDYPRNPIAADVWMDGAALASIADALADEMTRRGALAREEHASRIATGMALRVMRHYPEEVFPRVLRQSRCQESLGRLDLATEGYGAIVADYEIMELSYLLDETGKLDDRGVAILDSVAQAASRLSALRPGESSRLDSLAQGIRGRLDQT